jgi:hypothetical protein
VLREFLFSYLISKFKINLFHTDFFCTVAVNWIDFISSFEPQILKQSIFGNNFEVHILIIFNRCIALVLLLTPLDILN